MELVRRLRRLEPPMPEEDPYAANFPPLRRGPRARSGAAVVEPEEDSYRAFSTRRQRARVKYCCTGEKLFFVRQGQS